MARRKQAPKDLTGIRQRGGRYQIRLFGGQDPVTGKQVMLTGSAEDEDAAIKLRLPEPVEVAVYYVVSEALTNTAKHAHASEVHITVDAHDDVLQLSIRDDGCGGADPTRGSGLTGLTDRVDALGGTIKVASPLGHGTTLLVTLPTADNQ